jgi:hypothetical protein
MNDAATSLDRLHDIVEPPLVPWWPPAPIWYFVLLIAAVAAGWFARRMWQQWRGNAYRREALRELQDAKTPAEISEVLRRTALAIAPRSTIAALTGESWVEWLQASVSEQMPRPVHLALAGSVYDPASQNTDVGLLREYAQTWIERHRLPLTTHPSRKIR